MTSNVQICWIIYLRCKNTNSTCVPSNLWRCKYMHIYNHTTHWHPFVVHTYCQSQMPTIPLLYRRNRRKEEKSGKNQLSGSLRKQIWQEKIYQKANQTRSQVWNSQIYVCSVLIYPRFSTAKIHPSSVLSLGYWIVPWNTALMPSSNPYPLSSSWQTPRSLFSHPEIEEKKKKISTC